LDCRDFERWLDAGRPAAEGPAAESHRARCSACAERAQVDASLDAILATRLAPAAPGLTDRVMARVAATPSATPRLATNPELLVPWWIQVLREPEAILGLGLGALYAVSGPFLLPLARRAGPALLDAGPGPAQVPWNAWPPLLIAAIAVPLVGAAAWALFRAAQAAVAKLGTAS